MDRAGLEPATDGFQLMYHFHNTWDYVFTMALLL